MSEALDALKEHLHIYNPHNACTFAAEHGGTGVYLSYRISQTGRVSRVAAWQVVRPGHRTDPDGHFMDNGHKTFSVWQSGDRAATEAEAREWATKQFGIREWVKVPGLPGALFAAGDAQIIRDALKAAVKS